MVSIVRNEVRERLYFEGVERRRKTDCRIERKELTRYGRSEREGDGERGARGREGTMSGQENRAWCGERGERRWRYAAQPWEPTAASERASLFLSLSLTGFFAFSLLLDRLVHSILVSLSVKHGTSRGCFASFSSFRFFLCTYICMYVCISILWYAFAVPLFFPFPFLTLNVTLRCAFYIPIFFFFLPFSSLLRFFF